ncbi:glial maturation factor [Penicillium waksmanii]|uniref:glial maturation factor n=1 Tax=Penicillium waksmanii TaxID=69791 RepID=UPI0025491948|nr:glial maturation factor [Penicillium waksmanii]KAJ5980594.1 glial maturation factor [Penicillium waksmanii]
MTDSRLYSFSPETKEQLRKFRLTTSRAKDAQARIYIIDAKNQEIRAQDDEVYTNMEDLADDLPESSPRFILLSHPLTLGDGRVSVPYVMLYYMPVNCNPSQRMMYAGAVELMRNTAEVNRVIEVHEDEDIISIKSQLGGTD